MAWTQEQLSGAGQWIQQNLDNPALIRQKAGELGFSSSDLLQAARTVNPEISQAQVGDFMGGPWSGGASVASGGGGGGGGRGASAVSMPDWAKYQGYQENPYLQQQASGIAQGATRALNEQMLPGVRSEAIAAGGFGGSRQGIAEGLAMGRTSDAISNAVGNLYSTDYQQSQNRNLQRYQTDSASALGLGQLDATNRGIDNQYSLGMGGLDAQNRGLDLQARGLDNQYTLGLGNLDVQRQQAQNQRYGIDQNYNLGMTNADNNRYGTDRGYEVGMANANASQANAAANQALGQGQLALSREKYGSDMLLGLLDRQMGYNNAGIQAGGNIQNTPLNYWNQFSQGANSIGQGYGSSTQTGPGGNPMMGMLGGAQLGSQLGKAWGGGGQFQPGQMGQAMADNSGWYNAQIGM